MKIKEIIEEAAGEGRKALLEYEAGEIFRQAGIPVAPGFIARTAAEAEETASKIGFPVVMKIMSPQIIHKSDAGGVKVNLTEVGAVAPAWEEIINNARAYAPAAEIKGIMVQKMISSASGREVIVGGSTDPQFGPVVMFGLGGIFVEVLKDVSFRVAPVSPEEALRQIREIRTLPILEGVRGAPPIDFDALADLIHRISRLMVDFPLISELDANPVLVDEEGALALDARIILK